MPRQGRRTRGHEVVSLRSEIAVNRGTVFSFQNDPNAARAQYRKALSLAIAVGDTYFEANALGGLGFAYMHEERYDEAIDWFSAALEKSRTVNNPALIAVIVSNLGWCYYKLGDLDQATELFEQSASLFEELGMLRQERQELNDLGLVHFDQRDYVKRITIQPVTCGRAPDRRQGCDRRVSEQSCHVSD